jgi:hypothetical protein
VTVILELKPEVEAAARSEAQASGMPLEHYLQLFLEHSLPRPQAEDAEAIRQRRMEILSRLQGKYAGLPGGSEEFSAQKAEEKAREERHWRDGA